MSCFRSAGAVNCGGENSLKRLLIGKLGNVLLGDDGVGPYVIRCGRHSMNLSTALKLSILEPRLLTGGIGLRNWMLSFLWTRSRAMIHRGLWFYIVRKRFSVRGLRSSSIHIHRHCRSVCLRRPARGFGDVAGGSSWRIVPGRAPFDGGGSIVRFRGVVEEILGELDRMKIAYRRKATADVPASSDAILELRLGR
jgi:hypothetical protein